MGLLLVHLSDIHFKADGTDSLCERPESVAAAATSVALDVEAVVVVMSGDSAYSGRAPEYDLALTFYKRFLAELSSRTPHEHIIFVIVPGNHDCDFERHNASREIILDRDSTSYTDTSPIQQALDVQDGYRLFIDQLCADIAPIQCYGLTDWFSFESATVGNVSLRLQLFNSAWASRKHERQGQLSLPVHLLPDRDTPDESLVLSVIHHPFGWLESNNARTVRSTLDQTSDIILTGHEHESSFYTKTTLDGAHNEYVEGGVLQDNNDPRNSSFNVLTLDVSEGTQTTHQFVWNTTAHEYQHGPEYPARPFRRNARRLRNEFPFTDAFAEWTADPGAKFKHPTKKDLQLADIFVYPDFREVSTDENREAAAIIRGVNLLDVIQREQRVLIIGPDACGKTSLAKQIVVDLRRGGTIPLYADGRHFKHTNEEATRKVLSACVSRTYGADVIQSFWQLPPGERALVIDNYQALPFNPEIRSELLTLLASHFTIIVVLGGDEVRIEELHKTRPESLALWDFKHLEVMELGFALRSQMIRKWYASTIDSTYDDSRVQELLTNAEAHVTTFIGEQLMPAYPLFVLVVLQQLELATSYAPVSGSVGHIYESLVLATLAEATSREADADTNKNLLMEFAHRLYSEGCYELCQTDFRLWHADYCREYTIPIDFDRHVESLASAGMLVARDGTVQFRYPWQFYYFVAQYLAAHIGEDETLTQIERLTTYLHQAEAANIILFLCHLSRDPRVLDAVCDSADALFQKFPECNLDSDVRDMRFGGIVQEPNLLEHSNPEEVRQEVLRDVDDRVSSSSSGAVEPAVTLQAYTSKCPREQLNDQLEMNAALKTIQIIGQILHNHVGSLRGPIKEQLVEKGLGVGLRATSCLLGVFEEHANDMVEVLVHAVERRQGGIPRQRIVESVRKSLIGTLELGVFSIVKYTSDSLGMERMAETLTAVTERNKTTAKSIVDLAIRIDHYAGFPKRQALQVIRDVQSNPFALGVVRDLIWTRFYLHHTDYRIRQSIGEKLSISKKGQKKLLDQRPKKGKAGRRTRRK